MSITKLHASMTKISLAILTAVSSLSLSSCQDEDYGFTTQDVRDGVYKRNFENMYGKISEDQIWDFSSYNLKKLGLTGGPCNSVSTTRASASDVHRADYWSTGVTVMNSLYTVTEGTTDWLNSHLAEKEQHDSEVSSFTLKKTDDFYIIPIYQGQSGMIWDLELEDQNGRHRIWSKSENFQYTYDFTKWEEFFYDTNNNQELYNTSYTTTLSSEQIMFNDWGPQHYLISRSNIIAGDVIRLRVNPESVSESSLFGLKKNGTNGWEPLYGNNSKDYVSNFNNNKTALSITVTQDFLDALGSSDFIIQGRYITVTEIERTRGGANKGLKFQRIFNYFEPNVTDKYARMVFEIPSSVNTLEGYFYINDGNGFEQLGKDWFVDQTIPTNTTTIPTDDGRFTFTYANNPSFNKDGTLRINTNQVDLKKLIGQTINGHSVGEHFENLVFHATNTSFNTYVADHDRIKIYIKYNRTVDGVTLSNTPSSAYVDGHTINKRSVQTKLLKIDSNKIDGLFRLNLYTTDLTSGDRNGYSDYAATHYSDEGYMYAITHFGTIGSPIVKSDLRGELNSLYSLNLPENFEYMVLGCEDADGSNSDHDFNDVVFLLVGGPRLPEISDETIQKRYMIEDLGSTFDFDFNDIVVDVREEHVRSLSDQSKFKVRQTATISHLCGTIPFQVYLGTKTFGNNPMYGHNNNNSVDGYTPTSADYTTTLYESDWLAATTDLTALRSDQGIWDPNSNNIKVYVWPDKKYNESSVGVFWSDYSNEGAMVNEFDSPNNVYNRQQVEFPNKGKFPYIIATDPWIIWMKELVSIPTTWIKTVPKEYNDYNSGTSGGGSGNSGSGSGSGSDTPANKNLNNGPVTLSMDGNNWTQGYYTVSDEIANSLGAGDKLVFTANNNNFEIVLGGNWDNMYKATSSGNGTYSLELTAEQVNVIKNNKRITLNGGNVTISGVIVVKKS